MSMASQTITIHGRSSYTATATFADQDGNPVDLSLKTLYFETAEAAFRKLLTPVGNGSLNQTLHLTVEEVDQLPTSSTSFIIRDETSEPVVLGTGTIKRTGWIAS